MSAYRKTVPKINVGRYAGTPIDQLPNSYLRWMIGQKFPADWLEIARRKLANSDWSNEYVHVTRHALDMFSKRFLNLWINANAQYEDDLDPKVIGIATFVAKLAQEAWENGSDASKHRHQSDGTVRVLDGIKWVFSVNSQFPDYREVITVMPANESNPQYTS